MSDRPPPPGQSDPSWGSPEISSGDPSAPQPGEPPPEASPGRVGWGPARVALGMLAFIGLLVVWATIATAFDPGLETLGATLALQAALAATLVGVSFRVPFRGRWAAAAELGLRRPQRSAIGPSILTYIVYIACALVLALLISPEQEDVARELGLGETALASVAAGSFIIVAAPITEEIFFRGFVFAGLATKMPLILAALISSATWGIFHFTGPDSIGVVIQLTVFGMLLAWLYNRTGSLWPPIAVHAFNNALAFSLLASGV